MFDIGWVEMATIAVVALIIIGPKDLPKAMRTVSHWVGKARSLAREFQSGLDDIVRETELQEMRKDIEQAADLDLPGSIDGDLALPSPEDMTGATGDYIDGIAEPKPKRKPKARASTKPKSKAASKAGSKTVAKARKTNSAGSTVKRGSRSGAKAQGRKPAAKASKPARAAARKPTGAKSDA